MPHVLQSSRPGPDTADQRETSVADSSALLRLGVPISPQVLHMSPQAAPEACGADASSPGCGP
jgi:hypothetical protein